MLTALLLLPAGITAVAADTGRVTCPPAFPATSRHASADSIQAEAERQVRARFGQHYGCSALAFCGLCATLGTPMDERQLRSMSDSFAGGVAHRFGDGTCGALLGAVQALSMYASGDRHKHWRLAREVCDALQSQEGGTKCSDIYGKHKFDHCDACVFCAVRKVVEILHREGDISTRTLQLVEARPSGTAGATVPTGQAERGTRGRMGATIHIFP